MSSSSMPEYWLKWILNFYHKVENDSIFKEMPKQSDKMAVIIEPRRLPVLKYVIYNFMYQLIPKGWGLHIFCGTDNRDFVELITSKIPNTNISVLPYDNLSEPIYNMLLTNSGFWKSIYGNPTNVLLFQSDCILLKDNVDDFLKYDMIGAPWIHSPFKGCNGGLSLRNRERMITICKSQPWIYDNEDGFFSYRYGDYLNTNPSLIEKMSFSMETIKSEDPTGMHASYKHLKREDIEPLLEKSFEKIFK
jgi:hypothetical protein